MCILSGCGFLLVVTRAGFVEAVVVGLWLLPTFWWGWRCTRLGVFAGPDELVVRNLLRSHRVDWDEIADVRVHRWLPVTWSGRAVSALLDRKVGVVDVRGRARPVVMRTTASFLPVVRRSGDRTAHDVGAIRSLWLESTRAG
jgi:hypothetical protein